MMAYRIAAAAARLARLVKGDGTGQGKARLALVLRLENVETLRASIGPTLLEQMFDRLVLQLVSELRLLPRPRSQDSTEIHGVFAVSRRAAAPGLLARLQVICTAGIDLPDLRICPVINAVIVSDEAGTHDLAALYDYGRAALRGCSPLPISGQLRFVEMPQGRDRSDPPLTPRFAVDQVRLLFQPQLCCDTGAVVAMRVLPRITVPERGACDPAEFQARFDDETLGRVSASVLRQALTALKGWDSLGAQVPFVTLPLSDRELADTAIADMVLWELDRLDIAPDRLELELVEPIGRSGGRLPVTSSLRRLAAAGCRIALGEFGTGSAGLADLRRFGVRRVRIGREFTADCNSRPDQQRMILAVLALAEHLGLATLADGVASQDENAFLAQIGFHAVQGNAVVPPLEPPEADHFLLEHGKSLPSPFDIRRKA